MKVLLVNGSPKEKGSTYVSLCEIASALEKHGVESEFFHIGTGAIQGCIACVKCKKTGKCAFDDDLYNSLAAKIEAADGIVIGSPVYFAGPNGSLCALLDRVFYTSRDMFKHKPGAAVVICRRGGASAAFDRLNKYFTISHMPVVPSQYWNCVHANKPSDIKLDLEGLQTMRTLANNMAWLIKCIKSGTKPPEPEKERMVTSFPDGKL